MPAPKGHPPYPGCETGGRPKIYTKEFIDTEAEALNKWIQNNSNIFIGDFCWERGYHESRIDEFVRDNEKFSLALNMFKMRQKTALFKASLSKKTQFNGCALILGHYHGIYAKTEQKLSGDSVNPLECIINVNDGKTKDLIQEKDDE